MAAVQICRKRRGLFYCLSIGIPINDPDDPTPDCAYCRQWRPLSVPVDLSSPKVTDLTNNNSIQDVSAAGSSTISNQINRVVDEKLVLKLFEMFPEACPRYIRDICNGKQWDEFDDIVSVILSNDAYPRRPQRIPSPAKEVDLEEQYEIIKELLPDADPAYLRMECEKYINDEKGLKQFINQAMELKNYPTMKEYLRMQQLSAQKKQYTTEFNVENFVQLFPDPKKTFKDPNRTIQVGAYAIHYLNAFFRNRYDKLPARTIQNILSQNNYKILASNKAFKELVKKGILMKSRRKITPLPEHIQNIPILQELAYLTHKKEIKAYIQEKKKKEKQERLETKKLGLMQTCQCCFDEEIMPNDTFSCPNGCSFCRDCIKQSCEVALGEGKTNFSCLSDCTAEFTLQTLQNALPPKMFSKLAQKKAIAEVKAAGIPELETCPFCDFATIPNETDKIFRCLNADCMKESCRGCKQPNHVPLKCEEVEVDEAVKARTYVENKMTEALLRECWKCHTKFYKEEGCNKMTCSCGAQMCYICKAPVTNYSHFNGIGGDKFNLCPLYSDTNSVNEQNVLQAAASAKAEIDPSKLKVDPTTDIKEHYKNRGKQLPREPHMDLLRVNNPGHLNHHHRPRHRRRENYFMHFGEILNQQQKKKTA
ncbi:hypothetical protein NQ318_006734 [Aromia moschata]|uniref:RING-type domain-containing protein n=1 Tax=Aromia moschata TaxID=1265417 RepID=A0AAV8YDM8_9CUCU|nr:hypothetical protein NQ318_006734 [Aromia moschata]